MYFMVLSKAGAEPILYVTSSHCRPLIVQRVSSMVTSTTPDTRMEANNADCRSVKKTSKF